MAATRLIALHKNKGKSVAACLKSRTDYAQNPDKTNKGELVSSYECSPLTADEEFMLSKRQYELMTGRRQKSDVIAYQIRQSFKPGEITAEEANKVGYELAMRFTKGKYVRRFKNKKALVAFAGIDAPPFQSGNFESKSRHVSKRGSPHLRRAVFLVANIILTLSHKDNSVFCFMDKKRAEGKHYYVYTIAGSAKFLRIYYARVTEYLRTQEIPVAASCLNGNS